MVDRLLEFAVYRYPGYVISSNGFEAADVAALLEPFGEPAYGPHYQAFGGMTVPRRYLNAGLLPVLPAEEHSFACRYQDDVFGSANLLRRGLRVKFTAEDYDTSRAGDRTRTWRVRLGAHSAAARRAELSLVTRTR